MGGCQANATHRVFGIDLDPRELVHNELTDVCGDTLIAAENFVTFQLKDLPILKANLKMRKDKTV